ncbi:MAG: hypothetical protein AAGA85_03125 [Bacteroidota bacterium]
MIILKYTHRDAEGDRWVDRLKELSVPFRIEPTDVSRNIPTDDEQEVIGSKPIDLYLDPLAADIDQWYECACDKFFED